MIKDHFSDLPISRQRKYQLRKRAAGKCVGCGKPSRGGLAYCDVCFENQRPPGNRNISKRVKLQKGLITYLLNAQAADLRQDELVADLSAYTADRVNKNTVILNGVPIKLSKMAQSLGLSSSLLSRIFSGDRTGSVKTIKYIARMVGLSVDDLLHAVRNRQQTQPAAHAHTKKVLHKI